MFGANPELGLILLPIVLYHSLQLVVAAWLAARWCRELPT
jgi:sodium/bile acid cotransporter 7